MTSKVLVNCLSSAIVHSTTSASVACSLQAGTAIEIVGTAGEGAELEMFALRAPVICMTDLDSSITQTDEAAVLFEMFTESRRLQSLRQSRWCQMFPLELPKEILAVTTG